jgi:release factor glutamine methyltransferase
LFATIGDALAERRLPRREIEMLLQHVLGMSRASIIAHPEKALNAAQQDAFALAVDERARGVPIAYIIGAREFYGRVFAVSPAVLIPRPETELIVDQLLAAFSKQKWLKSPVDNGLSPKKPTLLDLGTGSGAIAISVSLEAPHLDVTACDISTDALQVARRNAATLGAKVTFVESDWFANLPPQRFDCIVSNPPYVAKDDAHLLQGDLRFEPAIALTDDAPDKLGLACIRHIVETAPSWLNDHGLLMFEHGYDQSGACRDLLQARGFNPLFCINDLAGIPRVSGGRWRH